MKLKKRSAIVLGVVILLLLTAGLVAATMAPSAEELLTESLETLESITSGHAVIEGIVQSPGQDISATAEVWVELGVGPNGEPAARLEVADASEAEFDGLTFVSDGSQFWLLNPNRNSVVVGQAEELVPILAQQLAEYEGQWDHGDFDPESADHPQTPAEVVSWLLGYFTVEKDGSGQIGENGADILRLVPKPEQMPEEVRLAGGFVQLWLRAADQLPIAIAYAEGAMGSARFEASQIQINEPIDADVFSFDMPPGVEVIQATDLIAQMETYKQGVDVTAEDVLAPTELPDGAVAAGTEQFGSVVVQRFTLSDDRSFVVAQGSDVPGEAPEEATSTEIVTVRGVEGSLFANADASRTLLVWQEGDVFVMVAGDLSPDQAMLVAESLQ